MRIVIAAGIYPPDIGGPAPYAKEVADLYRAQGHTVSLALFRAWKRFPSGIRHLFYTLHLARLAFRADCVIAFDTWSVGVPAALVSMITRTPVVVRVGGDFIWEQYLERTGNRILLPDFYKHTNAFSFFEQIEFSLVKFMARHTHLAFNTPWLREIWKIPYSLDKGHTSIVENIIPPKQHARIQRNRSIAFFTRQIVFKNSSAFTKAFQKAHDLLPDISLDAGALPRTEMLERVAHAHAIAIPSISEVAPNTLLEALAYGTPCILSKYSGYAEKYKDMCVLIDPLDIDDMARGIREIFDPIRYRQLTDAIAAFSEVRTYEDVARELLQPLKRI